MKKISSMLALGMALALTFGMTVSAAESPATTHDPNFAKPTEAEVTAAETTIKELPKVTTEDVKSATITDAQGNKTEVKVEVKPIQAETVAQLQSETANVTGKAVETLATSGNLTDVIAKAAAAANASTKVDTTKQTVTKVEIVPMPVAAAVIEIPADVTVPESGIQLAVNFPGFKPIADATYVVMHLGKNGWEVIAPDSIAADGTVTATFKDLSPVTVNVVTFEVKEKDPTLTGEDEDDEDEDADAPAQAAAPAAVNPATSPKTAETLPAAGVMALICLAGAAVCAGRIRYNK